MRITWEVEDGYVGKSRPQHLTIDNEEFDGLTEQEKQQLIESYVNDEFDNKIYPVITRVDDE